MYTEFCSQRSFNGGGKVQVEADLGVGVDKDEKSRHFGGVAVGATLHAVRIQELHEIIGDGGDNSIELVRHDLCAVLVPRFVDPDPVDLVFSGELYVPFGSFRLLEPVK